MSFSAMASLMVGTRHSGLQRHRGMSRLQMRGKKTSTEKRFLRSVQRRFVQSTIPATLANSPAVKINELSITKQRLTSSV